MSGCNAIRKNAFRGHPEIASAIHCRLAWRRRRRLRTTSCVCFSRRRDWGRGVCKRCRPPLTWILRKIQVSLVLLHSALQLGNFHGFHVFSRRNFFTRKAITSFLQMFTWQFTENLLSNYPEHPIQGFSPWKRGVYVCDYSKRLYFYTVGRRLACEIVGVITSSRLAVCVCSLIQNQISMLAKPVEERRERERVCPLIYNFFPGSHVACERNCWMSWHPVSFRIFLFSKSLIACSMLIVALKKVWTVVEDPESWLDPCRANPR